MNCLNCHSKMKLADSMVNVVRYYECECGVEVAVYANKEIEDCWGLIPGKEVKPGRLAITRGIKKGVLG